MVESGREGIIYLRPITGEGSLGEPKSTHLINNRPFLEGVYRDMTVPTQQLKSGLARFARSRLLPAALSETLCI